MFKNVKKQNTFYSNFWEQKLLKDINKQVHVEKKVTQQLRVCN